MGNVYKSNMRKPIKPEPQAAIARGAAKNLVGKANLFAFPRL